MSTITINSIIDPSRTYEYVDDGAPMRGGMKDVYFSPNRDYVVALFRDQLEFQQLERLIKIVKTYLPRIKKAPGADYYLNAIFRWPTDVVNGRDGNVGIIVPVYSGAFFFEKGYAANELLKGKEKNGKWFASPKFRSAKFPLHLDKRELGNWISYFQVGVNLCRGVKKMHSMGLAHSDLSYNNVLIDPITKAACMIDLDGLVVPGLFPAEVIGTAEFIAPEVLMTKHLPKDDPKRKLPSRTTDLHALAVLIYMLLLHRHPLKGSKVWHQDPEQDDLLAMGEKALFIEHETDATNRLRADDIGKYDLPWADTAKLPYTITGPYLSRLFERAFIEGLHHPNKRPIADEWEQALLKTVDLMQRCHNKSCDQQWYVFDNKLRPRCPFCGTAHQGTLPVLDLYFEREPGKWKPENHRLMVYNNQYLFRWHVNRNVIRNEHLAAADKKPVGYFSFHNGEWVLVNQQLEGLKDLTEDRDIPKGEMVVLDAGKKLLLDREKGGRVVVVSIANA